MAEQLNFQLPVEGFGSYCKGIIPDDLAVLAGAFSSSMQQINRIDTIDFENFAQVVFSLETNNGLPLTNGTNIPTNEFLCNQALSKIALGSAVYGTFSMSDFVGAMSGLPYPWREIKGYIQQLQTRKLDNIYDQLYLAVDWEGATATVQSTQTAVPQPLPSTDYNYYYQITGVTLTKAGGGYGRGGASAPTVTISGTSGATASCAIDTNSNNVPGTFGQVLTLVLTSAGSSVLYGSGSSATPTDPGLTVTIECPPTATLPVQANGDKATGGSNVPAGTDGWTGYLTDMDAVVDAYITQANDEIFAIQTAGANNFEASKALNTLWNVTGTALKIEQRSRYIAAPPVPIPYYPWMARYPQSLLGMIDTIPTLAQDTEPHGAAQTLEQIADFCTIGGQSLIAMMRQERNQVRLGSIGIDLDNNIPVTLNEQMQKILNSNGTLPDAVEGIDTSLGKFTIPAFVDKENCDGDRLFPIPVGYYDPNDLSFKYTDGTGPGNIFSILNISNLGPYGDLTGPLTIGDPNPISIVNVGTVVPTGTTSDEFQVRGYTPTPGPELPNTGTIPDVPTDGTLGLPGVLWPNIPAVPFNLQVPYTSSVLLPSNYDIGNAIDNVIECNCDCWV
jgi:hypothetical protein